MTIIKSKEVSMPIVNTDQLARGTNARYLECMKSHCDTLIALQWRRKEPKTYDVLIDYQAI
jgi:hypothetical protein